MAIEEREMSKSQVALNILVTARGVTIKRAHLREVATAVKIEESALLKFLKDVASGRRSPFMEKTAFKVLSVLPRDLAARFRDKVVEAEPGGGEMTRLFDQFHQTITPVTNKDPWDSLCRGSLPTWPQKPDDLKRIRGIGTVFEMALNRRGVYTYAQIAAWSPMDTASMSRALGIDGRIEDEHWVEQAHVLADGWNTAFSRKEDARAAEISKCAASVLEHP